MQDKQSEKTGIDEPERQGRGWPSLVFGGAFLSLPLLCGLPIALLLVITMCVNGFLAWGVLFGGVAVNQPAPASAPTQQVDLAEPRATLAALATQVAELSQHKNEASPAVEAPTPPPPASVSQIVVPPPAHPMAGYTIPGLRERAYPGGTIQVRSVLTTTGTFTRYYIDYPSDGLTITGIMQVPHGQGPFPVVILNHGYVPRERYWSGADTWNAAGYLNRRGYLTIAPDYRSWGESDLANSFFSTGQVIDVLNLIGSLASFPEADVERVGVWGHSMGGGVATKAITIDPHIRAAVLYAPVSADEAQVLGRWGTGCMGSVPDPSTDECAGAEVLTSDIDEDLLVAYRDAASSPEFLYQLSPANYFDLVAAPVQIHIGMDDTTTPPEWSAAIHRGLDRAGKKVEYYSYPGQGHAFEGESWLLFMERVADFFDRHLVHVS